MKYLFALLLLPVFLQAQYSVTFQLKRLPAYHPDEAPVFMAGSFNGWKPDSAGYKFVQQSLTISLPKGNYEYKLTRSTWQAGECSANGAEMPNRSLVITQDTTIAVEIMDWADHFNQQKKQHTASKNVHIVDTAFYMPQLNRYRRIWVYLPESYATSHKKYRVLYMQDGQNVFDAATSFSGEWGVDETLDTLGVQTKETIVVAIDHGGDKRITEYAPLDMEKWGKAEGDAYARFLVKTLKPYIQKKYRVKRCRKYQTIAGSSMGGLISFYTALQYPKAFGTAGVFSPAFWVVPQLQDIIATRKRIKSNFYFYAGKQESERMVPDMLAVFMQVSAKSKAKLTTVIRTGGEHNEARWRQEFPLFYKWLVK
ncbi:MAG TPA: alpha/beta hydrolase-fold protein [Chitinophagaceae bacterium]|nr:alpha/beta hydrolase-fold protein [Chitinophagaceae bacterium]